ncbi:hypothetical protein ETAE_3002 [Edwardsiella piscicida]|uniref:Uncharacterized protein n=1 Tax=Edwardsiella piscicida TaxID=1263550 RepID=A0AAU8P5H1_EDWPI|nr:hypothetical protein ETAE_3002 [Edwardsiella tarda EIB202]
MAKAIRQPYISLTVASLRQLTAPYCCHKKITSSEFNLIKFGGMGLS